MATLDLIGVPFDGFGRPGNQRGAAARLRTAGLGDAFGHHEIATNRDIDLPVGNPDRAPGSGIVTEEALLAQTDALNTLVGAVLASGRFPVVYGGDCTSLLGSITGARDALGAIALLHVDGHEDTMPLDVSEDGEAANMEIGLLLGLTGTLAPDRLRERLPALGRPGLALLGQRDVRWRRQFNVGTLADLGVWSRPLEAIVADPVGAARAAVAQVRQHAGDWWLHVDLDVLDPDVFPSQGVPGVEDEPGGLTWEQLTDLVTAALREGGCRGMSIVIYDPDQDPDGTDASRIVRFVRDIVPALD
ncbi:MAG TPA: arginase family protein [Thermomicrobiales bacterium]|jgi:arginase|nr:arginase family protein [Thermomicrobiales bacterium]